MRGFRGHKFRRRTLILWFCLGILTGVGLARGGRVASSVWPSFLAPVCLLACSRRSVPSLLLIIFLGLSLGLWRGSIYMRKLGDYDRVEKQKISLTARASEDAVYGDTSQLTFKASHVILDGGQALAGNIQLSGFGVNAVYEGDEVAASGELYPAQGSVQARMSYARLSLLAHHPSVIAEIRRKFAAGTQTALPEPLAPFAMGLLIGQRSDLPDNVKQDLLMVGLTHIIAVSGYNLTIILHASRRLLGKRSKRISTFLTVILIGIFLLLAGASASIVRAAIVSMLSIAAAYYGREIKPLNLLLLAAAITAWANPFYLWGDLSWYLSFLTFFGVLMLAPLIQARFPGRWHESIIAGVALESISAETMSLPFILHSFGQLSLIGLPANVLVTSLVPLAMLLCLIAGLAGMLLGPLDGWLAWPAQILLNYMLDVSHLLASLPGIFLQNLSLSITGMLIIYLVILYVILLLQGKTKRLKHATITDRNVRTQQMVNY